MTCSQPVKTLLFDLDGTLIQLDMTEFLPRYFEALGAHCAQNISPDLLVDYVLKSTEAMINNQDSSLTNQQVFEFDFSARSGLAIDQIYPLFDSFYSKRFPNLAGPGVQNEHCIKAIEMAMAAGLEVVIATNPVFPLVAIQKRLEWGKLTDLPFALITAYETMHACKPSLNYYQEILDFLDRTPHQCWMIGNDMTEDMVAGKLGIKTFLVEDFLVTGHKPCNPTRRGKMKHLPGFVSELIS